MKDRPLRTRTGTPLDLERAMLEHVGPQWRLLAQNRELWRELRIHAMQSWKARWPAAPISHFSNKTIALSHKRSCPWGIKVVVWCPCENLVRQCLGWSEPADPIAKVCIEAVRWNCHVLKLANMRQALGENFVHACSERRVEDSKHLPKECGKGFWDCVLAPGAVVGVHVLVQKSREGDMQVCVFLVVFSRDLPQCGALGAQWRCSVNSTGHYETYCEAISLGFSCLWTWLNRFAME